jgi:hypothetical protein
MTLQTRIHQARNLIGSLLVWGLWFLMSALEIVAPWMIEEACGAAD